MCVCTFSAANVAWVVNVHEFSGVNGGEGVHHAGCGARMRTVKTAEANVIVIVANVLRTIQWM